MGTETFCFRPHKAMPRKKEIPCMFAELEVAGSFDIHDLMLYVTVIIIIL